jgi:hypothetical protein
MRAVLLAFLLCGCAFVEPPPEPPPDPALELAMACVEAEGDYAPAVAKELQALCAPEAVRGRTPEQQRADAERVYQLIGNRP